MATTMQGLRCYHSHKPISAGGGTLVGGNCASPACSDANVYIGLDWSAKTQGKAPWDNDGKAVVNAMFEITDQSVPHDRESFNRMVEYVCNQLQKGKKVHIGCIGGHGRTGTVLAVILSKFPEFGADSAKWLRANYCKKAIESATQVDWLNKHYGIEKVKASKASYDLGTSKVAWNIDWGQRYGQALYDDFEGGQAGGTRYATGSRGSRLDPDRQKGLFNDKLKPTVTKVEKAAPAKGKPVAKVKVAPFSKKKSIWTKSSAENT